MDVICLGLITCDITAKPVTPDVMQKDLSMVDSVNMSNGGDALNVAINFSIIGGSSGIIGKIGNDEFGRFLLKTAEKKKVDTRGVKVVDGVGTAICIVLVQPDGERNFAYYNGAGGLLSENDIDYGIIKEAKILAIGGACLLPGLDGWGLANVLRRAQELGVKTAVDVSGDLDMASIEKLEYSLPYVDIFIPSYNQACYLTGGNEPGEISVKLHKLGVKLIVVKMGKDGCFISSQEGIVHIPAYDVKVVDTTGAGDSFVSGFLTGYSRGWPLYDCGRFANAAGAICVQEIGTTVGMKPFGEILKFIKNRDLYK